MPELSQKYRESFSDLIRLVEEELCSKFSTEEERFPSWEKLVTKFRDAASRLLERGLVAVNQFIEVHNELCVAAWILGEQNTSTCIKLEYEPRMYTCEKRFDFYATLSEGKPLLVEVKTINPSEQDDWEKFKKIQKDSLIPKNIEIILQGEMRGQIWHYEYAAREKMLEYTLSFEEKIQACNIDRENEACVLVLCSDGFKWHIDDLEDFVTFYRSGQHRPDDPYQMMEKYYIEQKNIVLLRNIDRFLFFRRRILDVLNETPKGL